MERSESLPSVLLFGGDGGRSGIPRHLGQICETLADAAQLTVARDRNRGGYDGIGDSVRQVEIEGLRTCLRPLSLWRGWRGVNRLLGDAQWDVIWLHARMPSVFARLTLAAGLVRPHPGLRLVVSYHGLPFEPGQRPLVSWVSLRLERMLLQHCPPMHLVCLTPDMAARLHRAIGPAALARHRVHCLPNSSNLGRLPAPSPSPTRRHLVITGRTGYQKNYALAARLMDHLPEHYILTLCGAGTEDPAFQARLRRLVRRGTRPRIHFAGQVADVRPLLAQADCYLLTSRYEGLPIGAIEAFEAGLPMVLTPFDAAAEMIAAHPLALCVALRELPHDAARIVCLVEEYRRNRADHAGIIREAWRRKYPYELWQVRVRGLMQQILAG